MALTDRQKEHLQSMHHAAADIQRWAMQQLASDRVSRDRCHDITRSSTHISELASRLEFERSGSERP